MYLSPSLYLASPYWLLGLILIILLGFLRGKPRHSEWIYFPNVTLIKSIKHSQLNSPIKPHIPWELIPLTLLIIALSRPQKIDHPLEDRVSGIDIILAIDTSNSMNQRVLSTSRGFKSPTRLDAAKELATQLTLHRPYDRIGAVAFSGQPYIISPRSLDHKWLLRQIDNLASIPAVESGTAIGSALATSANLLRQQDSKSRLIILITDGLDNTGKLSPIEAAKLAKTLGIKIYTISLNPSAQDTTLEKIASLSGGKNFRIRYAEQLNDAFNAINSLEKSTLLVPPQPQIKALFPYFAFPAIAFLFISLTQFRLPLTSH